MIGTHDVKSKSSKQVLKKSSLFFLTNKQEAMDSLLDLESKSFLFELYKELGGQEGTQKLVKRVYQYNSTDLRIQHFFERALIENFEKMFLKFLIGMLGGQPYNRKRMIIAHQKMGGLTDVHFDAFMHNFTIAMMHEGISLKTINSLIQIMETTREDVTGRTQLDLKSKIHVFPPSFSERAKKCPFCHSKFSQNDSKEDDTKSLRSRSSSQSKKDCNIM